MPRRVGSFCSVQVPGALYDAGARRVRREALNPQRKSEGTKPMFMELNCVQVQYKKASQVNVGSR